MMSLDVELKTPDLGPGFSYGLLGSKDKPIRFPRHTVGCSAGLFGCIRFLKYLFSFVNFESCGQFLLVFTVPQFADAPKRALDKNSTGLAAIACRLLARAGGTCPGLF
jgi:hypothetical protein